MMRAMAPWPIKATRFGLASIWKRYRVDAQRWGQPRNTLLERLSLARSGGFSAACANYVGTRRKGFWVSKFEEVRKSQSNVKVAFSGR